MVILVTGGAGYIGSHTVRSLLKKGYNPVVIDNLVYGHSKFVKEILKVPLIEGDISDKNLLENILNGKHQLLNGKKITAVIHFAAYAYVGESVQNPSKYYNNNVVGTINLLDCIVKENLKRIKNKIPIVFSSTCATYGTPKPEDIPINENCFQNPINPYGRSKLMIEKIIKDYGKAYGLSSVIFRYFNAAGADPKGDLGEDHTRETHLIPLILEALINKNKEIKIFGTDYQTFDGTCIRDFIHVSDLGDAHVLGLEKIISNGGSETYNLGTGKGHSVLEIINIAKQISGEELSIKKDKRRIGDPPKLIADSSKASRELNWNPINSDIETIIKHAWLWHKKNYKI